MSIIFFRFFLLFLDFSYFFQLLLIGRTPRFGAIVLACGVSAGWVLSCSLRCAAKILYEIMLVRIFCNFSFFFTQFFWLLGWVRELFWGFLRFQLLFSGFFPAFWAGFGSCFGDFYGFSYFFLGFFPAFGLILGTVLKVLWITAPQGPAYYAINLWLLYIMLI